METTILNFRLVKSEIDKYKTEHKIDKDHIAFLAYVMEKELDLDYDDIMESIIDGSNDRGIDAIYIDDEDQYKRPIVYLFQSKYYQSEDKFDRSLEGNALNKMQHAIDNLILKSPKDIHDANEFLLSKIRDIRALSTKNPQFKIVFCSNSNQPEINVKKQFESYIDEISQGQDFFTLDYIDLKRLNELITPVTSKQINTKLRLSGQYFDWSLGEARVIVGRIAGRELAELCKREGRDLFDRNVRGYFGRKRNVVNQEIFKTATDHVEGSRFFFLNNGITMVCSSISYVPHKDSPEIEVTDLQIVNGGQTTNSIHEAYQSNSLADSVYVLVKIVSTKYKDLVEKIAESTNTQTNVKSRDLRSNDQIQKTIEKILLNKGYFYETRKNNYKDNPNSKGRRIDMENATQAYYACILKNPADAKNKKKQLFGSLYEEIFSINNEKIPEDMLLSYLTLEWVRKYHPMYKDKFTFIKYAEYHSIALLHSFGVDALNKLDEDSTLELYDKILDATAAVVKEENEKIQDRYSHRMLFIDNTTYGRISEILSSSLLSS